MRRAAHDRGAGGRLRPALVALAVGLLAATGCGTEGHRSTVPANLQRSESTRTFVRGLPHASPQLMALQRQLQAALAVAGPGTGAIVYDLTAGQQLFALRAGIGRAPASVEKLYTTVAALNELGADARLETDILGAGRLGPGGTWDGNLYLRGAGDPTFGDGAFNRQWEDGYGPSAGQLAAQLRSHGVRRVTGLVFADASLLDSRPGGPADGYAPDIPDYGGELGALTYDHGATGHAGSPAAFAVRELVRTMRAQGISARAGASGGRAPRSAKRLAVVRSPPLAVLLKLMDVRSDDLFADLVTEQLGARFGGGGTISAGARVIYRVVSQWGVHPTIIDGSGLSRADRSSPQQVVAFLRALDGTQTGEQLDATLPVVGISGTVQGIGVGTPAQGRCVAKTGTLDRVSNLAGYCRSSDGHMLAFALFLDGPQNSQALQLLGRITAAIAKY